MYNFYLNFIPLINKVIKYQKKNKDIINKNYYFYIIFCKLLNYNFNSI